MESRQDVVPSASPTVAYDGAPAAVDLAGGGRSDLVPTQPRRATYASRKRRQRNKRLIIQVLSIACGIFLWQVLAAWVVKNELFLASPIDVLRNYPEQAHAYLLADLKLSGIEFILGFVSAVVIGLLVGSIMALSPAVSVILRPWVSGLYAVPIIAVAPLFVLWFGIGIMGKIAVVFAIAVFTIILSTEDGLQSTDKELILVARAFGCTPIQILRTVRIPFSLPFIVSGFRIAVGRALLGVVVAEFFGATGGVGFRIFTAANAFDSATVFSDVVVLAVAGIALTASLRYLERKIAPWKAA